jgi:hypothetical protein
MLPGASCHDGAVSSQGDGERRWDASDLHRVPPTSSSHDVEPQVREPYGPGRAVKGDGYAAAPRRLGVQAAEPSTPPGRWARVLGWAFLGALVAMLVISAVESFRR